MRNPLPFIAILLCIPVLIIAQPDTTSVVNAWILDDYFASRIQVPVDTNLENFQNNNPVFRNYTSVSTLGNYGQASVSNVFCERDLNQEFLLVNAFNPYMKLFSTTEYINTRKPFTQISYLKGGSSQNKEEILEAFHSQNLTKTLNVGLHYTTVGSIGQYRFQKVKNQAFNFFSHLSGTLYSYHLSFNVNKIVADENGGILNDSLVIDTTYAFTKDIPTLFGGVDNPPTHTPDVFTEVRNINFLTVQELSFRSRKTVKDSSATRRLRIFYPKLVYVMSFNRVLRVFSDINPSVGLEGGLYPDVLINTKKTTDSLFYLKWFNSARLQFQGKKNNHYFVDYTYEIMQYSMTVPSENPADTLWQHWFISEKIKLPGISYNNRLSNASISSGFSKVFANHLEIDLYGQYYLSGYRMSDFTLSGDMRLFAGKPGRESSILIHADNQLKTPDFLYTHYASNNFIWTQNLRQISLNHLSMKVSLSSNKFDIQGDYYLIRDFIYLNDKAVPDQYNTGLSLISFSASKRFDFWKMTSVNKLVYQKTDNEKIIGIPEVAYYNSTYLTHLFNFKATGGKLAMIIGFDLFYYSKYYAEAYMPSLTSFYRQYQKKLGNYPYFDAFVNVRLKRFRFYLKLEHVNSGWIDKNYFSVLHYPRNERNLKFGMSWTFYD